MKKANDSNGFDLTTLKKGLATQSEDFLAQVQSELVAEEQETFRDFVKAAYRLSLEKEKEVERLQKEVATIKKALAGAQKGEWDDLGKLRVPTRFFKEEVLRKHGKSLLSGGNEVRFMDFYVPSGEED